MKSNLVDRITVSIYEETLNDIILQKILNRIAQPKFRGQKLKEVALEYFRLQYPDLVKSVESELSGEKNDIKPIANTVKKNNSVSGLETWT